MKRFFHLLLIKCSYENNNNTKKKKTVTRDLKANSKQVVEKQISG